MKRHRLSIPLLSALVFAPAAHAEEAGELKSFGEWMVGCDNALDCTAIGLSPDMAQAFAYLKVTRGAGAESGPIVSVSILDETDAGGEISLALLDGDLPVSSLQPEASEGGMVAFAELGAVDHGAFIDALLPEETLNVTLGEETVPVSLEGMSAALRYMDAIQRRAGSAGALVAKGERPADTIPGPSPLPNVSAVALTAIEPPAERPEGLPTRDEYCPETIEDTVFEAEDGTLIWGVCNSAGAYNVFESYSIVRDGRVTPADLGPQGTGIGTGEEESGSTLVNAGLAEDGHTIGAFSKACGLGDCGSATSWVFDGEAFQLVEEAVMGECRGVAPDDWPVLYRAEVSTR